MVAAIAAALPRGYLFRGGLPRPVPPRRRGGVSKASKGINLSEDIFAGYTALIRGGAVTMKEYAQVGKGRDVGMQQIYKFEAKLSQGNAEQCLARDVSRVAHRLDFPRLLSYYFGGIGHYINSALTVLTIQVATYLTLLLAVYGAESIGHRLVVPLGALQVVLAGLGLLNTLPLLATLAVERGLLTAARDVAQVFASGGPLCRAGVRKSPSRRALRSGSISAA